jgi:hypothetical protein
MANPPKSPPKSPEDAMETMTANLAGKTGKNLDQWRALAQQSGRAKHGELVAYLKSEHGLTHGYANLVAHSTLRSDAVSLAASGEDLVGLQYSGAKAALRPIYDRLASAIAKFGPDVEISPKKGYVSLRRSKQFGLIQPSTATRLDVGINLKGVAPSGRLEAAGSFNAMVSHRVRLAAPSEVDAELLGWLRRAYDAA